MTEIGAQYWWDGMNEIQVRERAELTTDELIAEWATTHGEPFVLELTGPAGGAYTAGDGGGVVRIDTVDFHHHPGRTDRRHRRAAPHPPPVDRRRAVSVKETTMANHCG